MPPTVESLGSLLWHTSRVLQLAPSPYGFHLERRPAPSAGAIHPIHVLVADDALGGLCRYNPRAHQLDIVGDAVRYSHGLQAVAAQIVGPSNAVVLAFVAEPGLSEAKYQHAASLIWRDAGVLQGAFAIAAEGLDLEFRLLGATGGPQIEGLADEGQLIGVGLALVGARP